MALLDDYKTLQDYGIRTDSFLILEEKPQ